MGRIALASALVVVLAAVPRGGEAQQLARLVDRILDPSPPLGPVVDGLLNEPLEGGRSLGDTLGSLAFEGCLQGAGPDLLDGLARLRALHVRAVERRSLAGVWRTWERKLRSLPPDAYLLVTTWLDSPATARRLFLCDDGLPPSWKSLDPDAYVVEAITWFDVEVAEREHSLHHGAPGNRELAVMELMELRAALVDRYLSTYPDSGAYELPLGRMEDRLSLQWQTLVSPYHTGFTPKARADVEDPQATRRARVRSPFGGGLGIPDPRDLAARDRVVRSWRRQRALLDDELALRQEALDEVRTRIDGTEDIEQLDAAVLEAARLDARLAQAVSDLERMESRVRHISTGRPWVDGMLDNGFRRRAVRRLHRRQVRVQQQRDDVDRLVARATGKGAMPAGTPRRDGTGTASRGPSSRGVPGPGNWLEGLPGADRPTAPPPGAADGESIEAGQGWVERVYEGPLPLPSATWSDELVVAIVLRHPELDDTDARILLGLVSAAYRELGDRESVEQAVRRSLDSPDGLRIRGEESTLSELWRPGSGRSDQPVVTFVLTLLF